jgi:hypothetical protein
MEDFANNAVRDIAVQCAAQSAKTQTVMNCACWRSARRMLDRTGYGQF